MLNERLSVARSVAAEPHPAEADLDNAILHASRLAIAVVEGRRKARLPINIGQEGLYELVKAAASLVEARAALIAAHAAFRRDKEEIGLRAVAVGDLWDCPKAMGSEDLDAANVA